MDVAREPVELGDDQRRAPELAGGERGGHLRAPALVGAGLDLEEFGEQDPLRGGYMAGNGLALGFGAERLLACRDPDVGKRSAGPQARYGGAPRLCGAF